MEQAGEAAVVGSNDSVDKLQDFTSNSDLIENTIATWDKGHPARNSTICHGRGRGNALRPPPSQRPR